MFRSNIKEAADEPDFGFRDLDFLGYLGVSSFGLCGQEDNSLDAFALNWSLLHVEYG